MHNMIAGIPVGKDWSG